MADVVSQQKRSEMMSGIRGKNTRPELFIRKALHALGYRYKLHVRKMPGNPDLVFPKYRAVIFIHGCFWHGHTCHLFKWPQSRKEFWQTKINSNKKNDEKALAKLQENGWRVLTVWECAIKGKERLEPDFLVKEMTQWLASNDNCHEIRGKAHGSK